MAQHSVGIREMNHNAGQLIRTVQSTGESLTITDRGVPVAILSPVEQDRPTTYGRLVRDGKVSPATLGVDDIPHTEWTLDQPPTEILRELRGDR